MSDEIQGFRLSPRQRWLWLLRAQGARDACHSRCVVRLRGDLDAAALRAALGESIARHQALHTVFQRTPGIPIPIQRVDEATTASWRESAPPRDPAAPLADLPAPACDLERGPLVDAQLVAVGRHEHLLVLTCSALSADAVSLGNLAVELSALYAARVAGRAPEEEDGIIQYLQLAEWQQEIRESEEGAGARELWRSLGPLRRASLPLELAGARDRGAIVTCEIPLPAATAARIAAMGAAGEPFLLAAWICLLLRLSGEGEPPTIAWVGDGRRHEALRSSIGPFADVLPLEVRLTLQATFTEAIDRVREKIQEAGDAQDAFLAEEHWPLDAPLHEGPVGFELLRHPSDRDAAGIAVSLERLEPPLAPCRLKLTCIDRDGSLTVRIEAVDGLFAARALRDLACRFETLVGSALATPGLPVGDLHILGEAEERELVAGLNDTRADFADGIGAVHQLFERQAARSPQAIAVETDEAQLTYAEVNRRANRLAHALRAAGVGPESVVGLFLERSPEMVIAVLGILKSGGAYLPLDPSYPRERSAFLVADARPALLLTQERLRASLPRTSVPILDVDLAEATPHREDDPQGGAGPDNLAYVIYTSGSTGRPKGVMVHHRGVVNYLSWCTRAYGAGEGEGSLVHSPLGFDLTVTSLFSPLASGRRVRLLPDDGDLTRLAAALRQEQELSLLKLTPSHLELLRHNLAGAAIQVAPRTLVLGGEALLGEALAWWRERAPAIRLVNEYGPTETVVGCCVYEVPAGPVPAGPVPIGRPIANTRLYVLDERLRPVPFGVAGELYIGGEGVARGYLGKPGLTAERFVPDPFGEDPGGRLYKSGDVVRHLADGNLAFLGRNDQQVKVRGFRIELGEIESVLASHPAVRETAVLAREDEPGDRRLVAYLVAGDEVGVDELRQMLGQQLPDAMIPSHFVRMDALPLTANGKVDRKGLPPPSTERPVLQTTYVAPRTPAESALAAIWSEVLGVDQVGVFDSFFALGGDSIRSVRLVALAKQQGFDLTVQQLYQKHRIADLCAILPPAAAPESGAAAGEKLQDSELERLLDELDQLSDEEVATRLQAQPAFREQESPE